MVSWCRLITSTLVFFTLMLAVLVWRVVDDEDPALAGRGAPATAASAEDDDDDGGLLGLSEPATTHQS
jgi:hypothetical protein